MYQLKKYVIFPVLLFCIMASGCDKGPRTGAEENTDAYFRSINRTQRDQTANPEKLSEKQISILNGRAFIKMPEGAARMTEIQEKALSIWPPYNAITEEYIAWGGNNEVLVLHIEDLFFTYSGDLSKDFRALQYYVEADESEKAVLLSDYAVACAMPYDQIRPTFEGKQYILQAMILGAENTLMKVGFSLYSNEWDCMEERISFYQELAVNIMKTSVPGTRVLGAQAESMQFKQFELQIPEGYSVKNLEMNVTEDDVEGQYSFMIIEKIGAISPATASLGLKITSSPKAIESEGEQTSKPDVLLDQEIIWECKQWYTPDNELLDVWETVIPDNGKETLEIRLYPVDEDDLQELFDIIHTLERK